MPDMEQIKPGDELTKSKDLIADNIEKLKELFPNAVAEGKIDFTVLKDLLGEEIEEEEEYYRFTWAGKAKARREAHKPSTGTLIPAKEESVDWGTTENLYIEGDNLEVLKLLQKGYSGKIGMIFIDPPYNTGSDFVYKDDYRDNLENYRRTTGQVNGEGVRLNTNSESDGRYHSNWLNMMYPRLILARNLLNEEGVIYITIADEEIGNLIKICNEVFGENNFVANFLWRKKTTTSNTEGTQVSPQVDYTLCYRKSSKGGVRQRVTKTDTRSYPNQDELGKYRLTVIEKKDSGSYKRETMKFPIMGHLPREGKRWQIGADTAKELERQNRFIYDGEKVKLKIYDFEDKNTLSAQPNCLLDHGSSDEGAKEVNIGLFDIPELFDNPKPTRLIEHFISIAKNSDIVLDFFAGSSSTAHAVFKRNLSDGGNRKFIQIQLPELTDIKSEAHRSGFKLITEIGKERIRRAGKTLKENFQNELEQLDLGFKVFKLETSNIRAWDGNPDSLENGLFESVDNIKADRSKEDVLYEILLKSGLDLTLPIEEKLIEGKTVYNVGLGSLFLCLSDSITSKVAKGIGEWKEELEPEVCRVVFKDSGFTDVEKTNSIQILKRFGITEVKSI